MRDRDVSRVVEGAPESVVEHSLRGALLPTRCVGDETCHVVIERQGRSHDFIMTSKSGISMPVLFPCLPPDEHGLVHADYRFSGL